MSETPNYSTYHLEELKSALANIDEATNPEEAKLIREYIAKGGYAYPVEQPIEKIEFVSGIYKWSLAAILFALLALNAFVLTAVINVESLLPIAIQAVLLYMIFSNHKHTRTLIKVWCALLVVSGVFGFLSMYYAPEISIERLLGNLSSLIIGLTYLLLADKCVHLVPYSFNK